MYGSIVNQAGVEHYTTSPSRLSAPALCGVNVVYNPRKGQWALRRTCGSCYRILSAEYANTGRLLEDAQLKPRRPVE